MSYLDTITFEESSLLEGEQMKEYIQRKRAAKDAEYEKAEKEKDRYNYGNRDSDSARGYPTTRNNPALDNGRETAALRKNNKDIFPKRLTKGEKALNKSEEKEHKAIRYATNLIDKDTSNNEQHGRINPETYDYERAHDAARRHYRRTHKEAAELVEIAESMLESYQPDCIFC